jgi:hypothetical protein
LQRFFLTWYSATNSGMPNVGICGDIITHPGHRRFETNIYQTIAETLQSPV